MARRDDILYMFCYIFCCSLTKDCKSYFSEKKFFRVMAITWLILIVFKNRFYHKKEHEKIFLIVKFTFAIFIIKMAKL